MIFLNLNLRQTKQLTRKKINVNIYCGVLKLISVFYDNNLPLSLRFLLFVAVLIALVFAIIFHELAHGYVALWQGDKTAKLNGRLSLNPIKHFDLVGFLMLLFAGFGYAKPVPVNPYNFKHFRRGFFAVSIAGVLTNFILAFISSGIFSAILAFAPNNLISAFFASFFEMFTYFNLILCFFNLLPFYPLDGFNVLSSILPRGNRFVAFMKNYSLYFLIFLIGLSFIINRFGVGDTWMGYLNILKYYHNFTAGNTFNGFIWIWSKIFGQ